MIIHPTIRNFRPFIYLTLVLVHLFSSVKAQVINDHQICQNNGNYTSNSTYQANLNALLTNLTDNIVSTGFFRASVGQSPDRVNSIALCRGDIQDNVCTTCVQGVSTEIVQLCPNNRQAMMWYNVCMVRYSDASFFGVRDVLPYSIRPSPETSVNPDAFMSDLGSLLDNLRDQAVNRNATMRMAIGNRSTTGLQRLFALVQCVPDLSPGDCDTCLRSAATRFTYGRIGGRSRLPSCNIRYETVSFYNETRVEEILPPIAPPPRSSQPSGT